MMCDRVAPIDLQTYSNIPNYRVGVLSFLDKLDEHVENCND